jgi:hypothetical protein
MKRLLGLALVMVVTACSDGTAVTTTSPAVVTTSTAAVVVTVASPACGLVPYEVEVLPGRVDADRPGTDEVPQDMFTTIPGTNSSIWFDSNGEPALVFVRGALPPVDWPGERGEVSIDGARGVAGPLDDGTWMVAWFEAEGEPCDQYFMVFYPPVEPSEVEATVASLNRTAG